MYHCPICHKPAVDEYKPFCSKYCKNIDFLKWVKEEYRIPVQNLDEEGNLPSSTEEEEDIKK